MTQTFITIHCGLQKELQLGPRGQRPSGEVKNFWPVLQAVSNQVNILPDTFNDAYSLIFSSKTAVDFFYADIFQHDNNILNNCRSAYFVGDKSKLHFEQKFFDLSQGISCFSPAKMGMQNLISEFNLTESEYKSIFLTALEGKSSTVIQNSRFKTPIVHIPIYRAVPYQSDFLKTLFEEPRGRETECSSSKVTKDDKKVVFECQSAQILEQVVTFLMEYFSCNDILSFPNNIYFSCFGQSTFDKAKQFYAQ